MHTRLLFTVVMVLAAVPSFGQDNELGIFANGASYRSTWAYEPIPGLPQLPGYRVLATFAANTGYGISFNHYVTAAVSVELAAQRLYADSRVSVAGPPVPSFKDIAIGTISLTDVDAALQWHPARHGAFDPYVGAGVAWIAGSNLDKLHVLPVDPQSGPAELDDKLTWLVEGGANVRLTAHLAVLLQAKYFRYRSRFGVQDRDPVKQVRLDPLAGELGLRWRM